MPLFTDSKSLNWHQGPDLEDSIATLSEEEIKDGHKAGYMAGTTEENEQ